MASVTTCLAVSSSPRRLQDLQGQHFRLLQGTAKVLIGLEDLVLALDLIIGRGRDIQVGLLDLVETTGDIAARDLHPDVADAFEGIELAVLDLLDHVLGVVADAVEGIGDLLVAITDLHRLDLLAHDIVEQRRLVKVRAIAATRPSSRSEIWFSNAMIGAS